MGKIIRSPLSYILIFPFAFVLGEVFVVSLFGIDIKPDYSQKNWLFYLYLINVILILTSWMVSEYFSFKLMISSYKSKKWRKLLLSIIYILTPILVIILRISTL